jgi:hypothetical protein
MHPTGYTATAAKVAATEIRACKHCCDRWELFAGEGGEAGKARQPVETLVCGEKFRS